MERWPTATATTARKLSWHVVSVQPTQRSFRGLLADPFSTNSSVETGKSAGSAQPNRSQDSRGPPTPRATPVSRRSAIGMAHKRSIRLQCMMSFPSVSLLLFQPSCLVPTDLLRLNQSPL